jgi:putative NIF3 family GTP cyclohydrolase 1 type 2
MKVIEEYAPLNLAESWDNVGLIVGAQDTLIRRVVLCLDVTK